MDQTDAGTATVAVGVDRMRDGLMGVDACADGDCGRMVVLTLPGLIEIPALGISSTRPSEDRVASATISITSGGHYMSRRRLRSELGAYSRPSGECQWCDQWAEKLELDHVLPLVDGGRHIVSNLQWLCKGCHKAKTQEEHRRRQQSVIDRYRVDTRWSAVQAFVNQGACSAGHVLTATNVQLIRRQYGDFLPACRKCRAATDKRNRERAKGMR